MDFRRNNIGALLAVVPVVILSAQAAGTKTAANSDLAYDRTNFGSAVLAVQMGAVTGAPDSFTAAVTLQTSDTLTGSDFADFKPDGVNTAVLTGIAANGLLTLNVDLSGAKKYIAAKAVVAFVNGTSPAISGVATLVLGGAAEGMPPTAPTAQAVT